MGMPTNMNAKNPQQRTVDKLPITAAIRPPKSKAGAVTMAVSGMYVFGKDAPNLYCWDTLALGLYHEYVMRPSLSKPVCGSEGNPDGASCQRGSSVPTPGGRWKVTVRSVLPVTYWLP